MIADLDLDGDRGNDRDLNSAGGGYKGYKSDEYKRRSTHAVEESADLDWLVTELEVFDKVHSYDYYYCAELLSV